MNVSVEDFFLKFHEFHLNQLIPCPPHLTVEDGGAATIHGSEYGATLDERPTEGTVALGITHSYIFHAENINLSKYFNRNILITKAKKYRVTRRVDSWLLICCRQKLEINLMGHPVDVWQLWKLGSP